MRLAVAGNQDHQQENHNGDERQTADIQYLAGKMGFALLPVPQLRTVLDTDLIGMLEVPREVVGFRISISGISLQCAIQNLL